MIERPILFSAPMVRALLAGTKTQTRRAVKGWALEWLAPGMFSPEYVADPGNRACPYGAPGDRLWVRETCRGEELPSGEDGVRYVADDAFRPIEDTPAAAIDWLKLHTYRGHSGKPIGPKVPGIHMPRWASRLVLEVVAVRVERLQAISEADCIVEGCIAAASVEVLRARRNAMSAPDVVGIDATVHQDARHAYRALWDTINGAGAWDANPWVWVVEFRRCPAT